MKNPMKGLTTASELFIVLVLSIVGLIATMVLMLILQIVDSTLIELWVLKVFQLLQGILVFGLPAWLCAYLWSQNSANYLSIKKPYHYSNWVTAVIIIIGAFPIVNLLSYLNNAIELPAYMAPLEMWMRAMEMSANALIEEFMQTRGIWALLFNLLVMAITPAICEEMLFRGVIQRILGNALGKHWGIWLSAFIFSFIHLQFYGFFPRLLLGALFGYMLLYSGSLWIPIVAHFTHNALSIIIYYIGMNYGIAAEMESIGYGNSWWLSVIGAVLFCTALWYFLKQRPIAHKRES